jgi:hypothetical protein
MKLRLSVILFFYVYHNHAQVTVDGEIKDAVTNEAIPYCAIGVKNTAKGCLTNEEGVFKLTNVLLTDTLVISYVGYKRKTISILDFTKNTTLYLVRKDNVLNEVVVYSNDDYLYSIFEKCRKQLLNSKQQQSKAYFVLETELKQQPVELLECYYNASFNSSVVEALNFKNGRVGLAPYNERYFINQNTSKVFTFLNLLGGSSYLPTAPLQLNKRQLKKSFRLKLLSVYDTLNPIYKIAFNPIDSNANKFSGEMWIEKNTSVLKKITLIISKTTRHPFRPIFKDFGEIQHASMQITKSYYTNEGLSLLDHIDFNYQMLYRHRKNVSGVAENNDTTFEVTSKGLLYFYDYNKLFIIPKFSYNADFSDYQKITSLTYNEGFWNTNNSLVYSDKMTQGINYFKTYGQLINYKNSGNSRASFTKEGFFKSNYLVWSKDFRLSLKNDSIKNDTLSETTPNNQLGWREKYRLRAQLFLDINEMADSLQHFSASIFDVYETFYNLKEEPYTNCFLNIYFDLYEIERRKMEKIFSTKKYTRLQLDSIYQQAIKNLETQTFDYIKQVNHGTNIKALEKWNDYVLQNLGISNFNVSGLKKGG